MPSVCYPSLVGWYCPKTGEYICPDNAVEWATYPCDGCSGCPGTGGEAPDAE